MLHAKRIKKRMLHANAHKNIANNCIFLYYFLFKLIIRSHDKHAKCAICLYLGIEEL